MTADELRAALAAERETTARYREMYETEASYAGSLTARLAAEREKVARLRAVLAPLVTIHDGSNTEMFSLGDVSRARAALRETGET